MYSPSQTLYFTSLGSICWCRYDQEEPHYNTYISSIFLQSSSAKTQVCCIIKCIYFCKILLSLLNGIGERNGHRNFNILEFFLILWTLVHIFFYRQLDFYLSLKLLTQFWKTSLNFFSGCLVLKLIWHVLVKISSFKRKRPIRGGVSYCRVNQVKILTLTYSGLVSSTIVILVIEKKGDIPTLQKVSASIGFIACSVTYYLYLCCMVLVTIDRFMHIVYPFHPYTHCKKRYFVCVLTTMVTWIENRDFLQPIRMLLICYQILVSGSGIKLLSFIC